MENTEKEVLLSIQNLDVVFGRGKKGFKAVDNVSFDIYKGETLSLVGESGSGKTTIGRAIIRINPCSNGTIYFKGKRISSVADSIFDRDCFWNAEWHVNGKGRDLRTERLANDILAYLDAKGS